MSSFRNHRVVIASLFLPSTAVFEKSAPATPDLETASHPATSAFRLGEIPASKFAKGKVAPVAAPVKSLIDDLKDKSKHGTRFATPTVLSPEQEKLNPFAKLPSLTVTKEADETPSLTDSPLEAMSRALEKHNIAQSQTSPPPASRKYQTTHTDHQHIQSRVQRKNTRSSSRRPEEPRLMTQSVTSSFWHVDTNPHGNGGLRNAVDSIGTKLKKKLWVGTLGTNTDSLGEGVRKNIDSGMLAQCDSVPVWIPDAEFESCYDEFCHQVLWPCLHYAIPDAPKTKLFYESASFKQYKAVNQRFADAIISNYQEGDIIWVNDYHLMLLPSLLRASPSIPSHAPIGFFMHVAFPSSEIFRCLSVREHLLRGLLDADLVGFQTANYARHFRQTVSRILSLEALPKGIQLDGRFVDVGVFPMGIDVATLRQKRKDPEVTEWVQVLKQRYAGMKIIVGRDKLDEIQGVRHKIQAFEYFLEKYPQFQEKIVLIQVALQTTESNEIAGGVADVVSHINSRFSTLTYQPVVFLHTQDLTFSQYLALLTVADTFLATSLREGMALRTHEFVECQDETHRPLILSEFTGSYSYSGFRSCIAINPWDKRGTAAAINQALTMSDEEALSRWEDLHSHVITQTAQAFVTSFLNRCVRANTEHLQTDVSEVPKMDMSRLLPRYKHSKKRLLLIDFESTLWIRDVSREGLSKPFQPPADVIALLNKLADDPKNEVWLLSGLAVEGALDKVSELVPKIGIVAENGCFIKTRPSKTGESTWINTVANFNLTWKSACMETLNYFSERTTGAFVEERQASIVWRFWTGPVDSSSDRQWARRQAAEAQNHIFDSLGERYGLRIIPGANSFLVLPNNVSRSTAVGTIIHPGGPAHAVLSSNAVWSDYDPTEGEGGAADLDFVLAVSGDGKLLRRLNELDNSETVSTSNRGTDAKWKLDPEEATKTLWQFANLS